jgi:hypothetical protein
MSVNTGIGLLYLSWYNASYCVSYTSYGRQVWIDTIIITVLQTYRNKHVSAYLLKAIFRSVTQECKCRGNSVSCKMHYV